MKAKDAVKKIANEFDENNNSHVFLVETNNIEMCIKDIKGVIKGILKADDVIKHQIDSENYLELIVISPEEDSIKIDQIKELQSRIKTKPILGEYIFYMIVPAEKMNEEASNKLLKTIEEPNKNVIGFMISANRDLLLPTIKSRCEIISMMYDQNETQNEIENSLDTIVTNLITAIENNNHIAFYKIKSSEKEIKENSKIIENLIKDYYNTACYIKRGDHLNQNVVEFIRRQNTLPCIIKKAQYMNGVLNKLTTNVNSDLMLEKIFLDLKGVK